MKKTWNQIKDKPHDASGINNPEEWYWDNDNTMKVYYPMYKIKNND